MENLNEKIEALKKNSNLITKLEAISDILRKEIQEIMTKNHQFAYKNDFAVINRKIVKTVKYDTTEMIQFLKAMEMENFIEVVPEEYKISKEFEEQIKEGKIEKPEFVNVIEKEQLAVRFIK